MIQRLIRVGCVRKGSEGYIYAAFKIGQMKVSHDSGQEVKLTLDPEVPWNASSEGSIFQFYTWPNKSVWRAEFIWAMYLSKYQWFLKCSFNEKHWQRGKCGKKWPKQLERLLRLKSILNHILFVQSLKCVLSFLSEPLHYSGFCILTRMAKEVWRLVIISVQFACKRILLYTIWMGSAVTWSTTPFRQSAGCLRTPKYPSFRD